MSTFFINHDLAQLSQTLDHRNTHNSAYCNGQCNTKTLACPNSCRYHQQTNTVCIDLEL